MDFSSPFNFSSQYFSPQNQTGNLGAAYSGNPFGGGGPFSLSHVNPGTLTGIGTGIGGNMPRGMTASGLTPQQFQAALGPMTGATNSLPMLQAGQPFNASGVAMYNNNGSGTPGWQSQINGVANAATPVTQNPAAPTPTAAPVAPAPTPLPSMQDFTSQFRPGNFVSPFGNSNGVFGGPGGGMFGGQYISPYGFNGGNGGVY